MFGRESLRKFLERESGTTREVLIRESETTRDVLMRESETTRAVLMRESETTRDVLIRESEATRSLIDRRHEEFLRIQEQREEESREFMREIRMRNEKGFAAALAELEKMGRRIEESAAETRAGTQAILRLLDRFDESGGAPA